MFRTCTLAIAASVLAATMFFATPQTADAQLVGVGIGGGFGPGVGYVPYQPYYGGPAYYNSPGFDGGWHGHYHGGWRHRGYSRFNTLRPYYDNYNYGPRYGYGVGVNGPFYFYQ